MSQQSDKKPEKSNKETIKEIIEIVIFLGLAILLVFSFNWILAAAMNTDMPLVVVTSESMEPTYLGHRGEYDIRKDMLIVKGVEPSEIQVGDTIVFWKVDQTNVSVIDYSGIPIVHRVNHIYYNNSSEEYWFTTKGDNNDNYVTDYNAVEELTIHESRLIGKIVGRVKYLGGFINFFKTTTGTIVLISIIAVIMLATWLLGSSDEEKEEDPFTKEEEANEEVAQEATESSFWDKLKSFYKKVNKHKHIVYPALILGIIVCVPIFDSLIANWGTHYGVQTAVSTGAENQILADGNNTFIHFTVTIGCPGHWHQTFRSFNMKIANSTTGEIYGENNWTVVYNFEGTLTVKTGVWIDASDALVGGSYNLTITANLRSKFGKTMTDIFILPFNLIMR